MTLPVEPSVYEGTAGTIKNTTLLTHTLEDYMPKFREVVFNQTPTLKAFAVKAFGKDSVITGGSYGNSAGDRQSSGKGIVFTDPSFQFSGPILTSAPSGTHVGRMGTISPEHNDPGNGYQYAYKRLYWSIMVPEEFVKDNAGTNRLMNRLDNEMKLAQMAAARDVNYLILGHSSRPSSAPHGLPYLVSVTQDTSVGNLSPSTYSWWRNKYRECASVGGGGDADRPLAFLRKLESILLDVRELSGSSDDQMLIASRGAYQYYSRAAYADTTAQGARNKALYDAGIDHIVYAEAPMIYDSSWTVPYGGTASREGVYVVDTNECGLACRRDEFFDVEPWEGPRTKDQQRFFQTNIWLKYAIFVSNRRIQAVLYNIPANADAA